VSGAPLVLFLCVANAARSQLAEALLRHTAAERLRSASAGLRPTEVHPLTRAVLREVGVSDAGLRAKPVSEFFGREPVRFAVMVCEEADGHCPRIYPFTGETLRWPHPDPCAVADPDAQLDAFRNVRDSLRIHIDRFLAERGLLA
jgi:arsenate reductase